MTKWKLVQGSQAERPLELDRISSPTTVYQRRNIRGIAVEGEENSGESSGNSASENGVSENSFFWEYEERELTVAEFEEMERSLESPDTQAIMQAISSLELAVEMLSLGI